MALGPDDSRARQARIQRLIDSGESVVEPHMVPDAATAAAATAASSGLAVMPADGSGHSGGYPKHTKNASGSHSRGSSSPSTSRNRGSGGGAGGGGGGNGVVGGVGGGGGSLEADDVALQFEKQTVIPPAAVGSTGLAGSLGPRLGAQSTGSSSLAKQLSMARGGLDDAFPRSASMKICKYTVYLPHDEGAMVQIAVPPTCTAHELVKAALRAAVEENGGELPSGLMTDPFAYRAHVAEEDGEVDTDFPVLDVRVNVATLGVDSFVLRDRVDAAVAGRPAALSACAEGPGEDHSRSQQRKNIGGKAFSSLETEQETRQTPAEQGQRANKRTILTPRRASDRN